MSDAILANACQAARSATDAYNRAVMADMPTGVLIRLFEREHLALQCVAITRALTASGLAEKAILLADYGRGPDPGPETLSLALSIAEDAVAYIKAMIGEPARA